MKRGAAVLLLAAIVLLSARLPSGYASGEASSPASVAMATLVAGLILLGGHIAGHLLAKVGLPRISGYLGLGILLGPQALAVIDTETASLLGFLNELAVAFIALAAGAELRLQQLRERIGQILRLTLSMASVVSLGVFCFFYFVGTRFLPMAQNMDTAQKAAVAVLLGILAVARSPSSALAIIRECRARGPFPDTVLGVTVALDVLSIVLFAMGLSLCQALVSSTTDISFAITLGAELFSGIAMGVLLGAVLAFYIARVPGNLALLLLGTALVVTHVAHGIADYARVTHELPLHLEPLLICVTAGFTVRNLSSGGDRFAEAMDAVSLPVFVLFFCLAGASLDLQSLSTTWAAALLYVVVRGVSLFGSCWISARGDQDRGWYGISFLTQAGVSLGLALEVVRRFPEWGEAFATIAVAAISINQLIGPVAMKLALQRASSSQTR
ncbi:MAG: hypothetical protein HN712_06940 [Gemmatimonadetes bacterium]|jgi:Kef-type K+ transport system membrane component KefB|nr:hypothetical protein [Gemmatimonadota bacterium]MBT6150049.1 hypothetical protein [Gemmatimonadota bacterium]MBT7860030.1 hypothetical protein [Gemmatimonadota bacterium]